MKQVHKRRVAENNIYEPVPSAPRKHQILLSQYDPNNRDIVLPEEYDKMPKYPTQGEILLGTLQYAHDVHYGKQPTIRDNYLAHLPSSPTIINDLKQDMESSQVLFNQVYPELPPLPDPIYSKTNTLPRKSERESTVNQIIENSPYATVRRTGLPKMHQ